MKTVADSLRSSSKRHKSEHGGNVTVLPAEKVNIVSLYKLYRH